ncbi:hypothetical protein CEXT_197701 [Caerostris extrusa]|uniref:Uncharacterized protein n=1 Tax=Caerostris extrusa TaxID=172846 RepID=A0AAV4XM29_CAEEX|nr:hypothetical protein CEXT_197701 [Caerostris extrusa]
MSMWIRDSQSIALRGFWQDAKWKIIIHFSETRGRKSNHVEECVMAPTRLQDKKNQNHCFCRRYEYVDKRFSKHCTAWVLARCEMENNHSFLGNEREKEQSC